MRLIDADALKMNFPHDEDWDYPVNTNQYVSELIDSMPIVDAIPVEWIKIYMITETEKGDFMFACLCELLRDWRYANEDN